MTDLARGGFDAWIKACPPPTHTPDKPPFLTPTSVFLFEDVVSQVRAGTNWAGWQWCDSPRLLAGMLLHVTFPDIASWWFDESGVGKAQRMPLRTVVEAVTEANQDDRDFFSKIADDLEALEAGTDPVNFDEISAILERFTARFNETPKWNFSLEAFPSTLAAGAALLEQHGPLTDPATGEDFTEAQWLDLCAKAGTDRAASTVITAVFDDAFTL